MPGLLEFANGMFAASNANIINYSQMKTTLTLINVTQNERGGTQVCRSHR